MTLDELRTQLPEYAKDLRLNLDSVLSDSGTPGLTPVQIAMVAVASAIASRHEPLTRAITDWAAPTLGEAELNGARAAAAIMAMTNVYYRFTHLVGDAEYQNLRAGLRMNVLANPAPRRPGSSSLRSRCRRSTAAASACTRTRRCCASMGCPRARSRAPRASQR